MMARQSGQAMMVGLILLLVVLMAALFSHQIVRIIKEKSALLVAADAAAFSVAQEHASVLNTHAFLNRAGLANQLALAHLTTMASAERFRQKQSMQSASHNPPATVIGMLFGPQHAAAYVASQAGSAGGFLLPEKIKQAYRWHDRTVHELISRSQQDLIRTWPARRDQVFEESLIRNLSQSDPLVTRITLKQLGVSWQVDVDETKSKVVIQGAENEEWLNMLDAVVNTQSYLSDRDYTVRNKWMIHPRCPWRRHALRRKGTTQLTGKGVWKSEDTLSFHAVRSNKWIGCYMREYPMGWSIVNSGQDRSKSTEAPRNFSREAYWKWLMKREGSLKKMNAYGDNRLAHAWSTQDAISLGGSGLGKYSTLNPLVFDTAMANSSISIRFQVTRRYSWMPTLTVRTRSEVFFSDPAPQGETGRMNPSLFMPYWQGRIVGELK